MSNLPTLPTYQCHKRVQAAMIVDIAEVDGRVYVVGSFGSDPVAVDVPVGFFARSTPSVGDYLVIYEDGYMSHSPAAVFEAGYGFVRPAEKHVGVKVYRNFHPDPYHLVCAVSGAKAVERWGMTSAGEALCLRDTFGGLTVFPHGTVTMVEVGYPFDPEEG